MRGGCVAALIALAGCELVFPPNGSDPTFDGAVADGPSTADADPLAPDGSIDAPRTPPPDANLMCQAPDFECLSADGPNGTVPCSNTPYDYCESAVLDALDPYDLCSCSGSSLPYLYVFENGGGTATVVLVSNGIGAAGLDVDDAPLCYQDDGGCGAATTACGMNVDVLVWLFIPISPAGNQLTVMDPMCTTPYYTFMRP